MKVVVGDCEANDLLDKATVLHCAVFKDIKTNKIKKFYLGSPDGFVNDMIAFLDKVDVLIMHNGTGYDWPLWKRLLGYDFKGKKIDTLIMSRMLDPKRTVPPNCPNKKAGPNSVEAWGYRLGRGKPEHNDWSVFSQAMLHRCTEDVEIQHLIYKALLKEASKGDWKEAFRLNHKLFEILQKQEEYGWLVDKDHMNKCIRFLTRWMDLIDRAIIPKLPVIVEINETKNKGEYKYVSKPFKKDGKYNANILKWMESEGIDAVSRTVMGPFSRISFRRVDLDKSAEVKTFLLNLGWEPKEWNYDSEGERTSPKLSKDDPFEGIQGSLGRLVARRVQCKQRRSIVSGWFDVVRSDGRMSSIVNSLAATGRATHRNIVNVPGAKSFFGKWMRQIFVAKPGWVLVGTDSDACQIRMLAGRMNDDKYTETILRGDSSKGTDMHTINQRAANLPTRDDAKTFFYGFLFGAGDAKIGKIVHGTASDGKRLKEQFMKGLPALGKLMDKLSEEWKSTARKKYNSQWNRWEYFNGYITGLDGRPIKVPSEHQILVYLLQSDEAIMMAAAYCIFEKKMQRAGYKWYDDYGILCWYHDEFTVECIPEISETVGKYAEDAIKEAGEWFKIPCPHEGHAKIGINWYEIH